MYHTQERRVNRLTCPVECAKETAWLGTGYYFWDEEIDAIQWGHDVKRRTGYFEIYFADIDCENVLDTVFNESHYNVWRRQIEKVAKAITEKTGLKANLKEINAYITERAKWSEIADGILFQDLPKSPDLLVQGLFYRKRIQLAVYKEKIIKNFTLHSTMRCNNR